MTIFDFRIICRFPSRSLRLSRRSSASLIFAAAVDEIDRHSAPFVHCFRLKNQCDGEHGRRQRKRPTKETRLSLFSFSPSAPSAGGRNRLCAERRATAEENDWLMAIRSRNDNAFIMQREPKRERFIPLPLSVLACVRTIRLSVRPTDASIRFLSVRSRDVTLDTLFVHCFNAARVRFGRLRPVCLLLAS